jgi:hypothetical protein
MNRSTIPAALLCALLTACGGGGGAGDSADSGSTAIAPATTMQSAQGAYQGTVSNGREHTTIVLENDEFYTMYGNTVNGMLAVTGFLHGHGKSNDGNFSSTDVKDFAASGPVLSGSVSATYVPGASLSGVLTEGTNNFNFTGAPIATSVYYYNAGANPSNITGSWNLTSLRGFANVFSISPTGAFTGFSGACSFGGTITSRASGKNVFNVTITFGASPCILAGQSLNGIAVEYPLADGKRQLVIAAMDAARVNSAAFIGIR